MNRLRLAVIGAGHLGRIHARLAAANPAFELVAVVDPIASARDKLAAEFGSIAAADYRPLLGRIDAAVIATPTRSHHAVACDLLAEGVHLLVEKPLTADLREADELVAAASRRGTVLQVGHVERFNPVLAAVADRLAEPKYIEARRYSAHSLRSTDIGVVLDLMIHDIDVALSLVASPVVDVSALGLTVIGPYEDVAAARLTFANGCVANLSASRVSYHACREMQVWSAQGFVGIDFGAPAATIVRPGDSVCGGHFDVNALNNEQQAKFRDRLFVDYLPLETVAVPKRNAIADELADFADSIFRGREPRVTGQQGRAAIATAERIVQAIACHAWDGRQDGRIGPAAGFQGLGAVASPPTTLHGPHWQSVVGKSAVPRRQAG